MARDRTLHFYRKGPKIAGPGHSGSMQKVDLGIALCHFDLAAREAGLEPQFRLQDPGIPTPEDLWYTGSYFVK